MKNDKIYVEWKSTVDDKIGNDEFDTVLMAIGRSANTKLLNLDSLGIKLHKSN